MTPASRAPGEASVGMIWAATASSSLASSGVRISNGARRARARRACAAGGWAAGRWNASQAPPTSVLELATKSRRGERSGMRLFRRGPAVGGPPRVRQVDDLPSVRPPHQLEHIHAAVTELLAAIERVLGPHRRQPTVHADLGIPDAFVPHVGAWAPHGGQELPDVRQADPGVSRRVRRDANQPGAGIECGPRHRAVARPHAVEHAADHGEHLLFGGLGAERRRGEHAARRQPWEGFHSGGGWPPRPPTSSPRSILHSPNQYVSLTMNTFSASADHRARKSRPSAAVPVVTSSSRPCCQTRNSVEPGRYSQRITALTRSERTLKSRSRKEKSGCPSRSKST